MNGSFNPQTHPRTWLITGATSGIGRELALQALENGDAVAALARDTSALDDLAEAHDERLLLIPADVRDEQAVQDAVEGTLTRFGRIDVVANNAGYGLFGAVEEASDTQVRAVFDTNVFGVLNVLRATLPVLRAQRSGHILQGSSVYGQSAHPGVGLLAATKYAVEGLSDALAAEVAPLGIKVTIIQPGLTATPSWPTSMSPPASATTTRPSARSRRASASCRHPRSPPRRASPQASGLPSTAPTPRCAWPSVPPARRACAPLWKPASRTWTAGRV
ncbi:SDR family NAD(P)-dependent oxidoreductase [Streptomyces cirratus]|uniref:SDR family NAD(P)-dependent oxidoreductase n=1 Tax=Streptomyces cirratus TaxID=68187 RepID=UPI00360C2F21